MWRTLRSYLSLIFSKGSLRPPGSIQQRGRWLTARSSSPPFKSSWRMHSTSMHGLEKRGITNGGGEALPVALAYWQKCKRCCSTTAPNSSPSPADYCRRERHESASARFDANPHSRNGPKSRLYSRARACAGADPDQNAGKGARKSNRRGVIRGVFLSALKSDADIRQRDQYVRLWVIRDLARSRPTFVLVRCYPNNDRIVASQRMQRWANSGH